MFTFRENKLSRIRSFWKFRVINFRENGQNSRNSRKFLPAKVSSLKVDNIRSKLRTNMTDNWVIPNTINKM